MPLVSDSTIPMQTKDKRKTAAGIASAGNPERRVIAAENDDDGGADARDSRVQAPPLSAMDNHVIVDI